MDYCTCGARTVEGAQFCHKCGRPLYEKAIEPEVAEQHITPVEVPVTPAVPAEINFRNAVAVRVGFLVAGLGMFLNNLTALTGSTALQLLSFLGLTMISGGFAVWLYNRRTGQHLSVKSGARLGWITGVFSFVLVTVMVTLTIALVGPEKITEMLKDPTFARGVPSKEVEQALSNPLVIAMGLLMGLCAMFAAYTVTASIGGAFGAKLLDKGGKTA